MSFKHPEILYFLLALVLPIIVHLFQLRRFKIQYFTNVKLLKQLSVQTRKSASIKKWLLLATRLALLAMLIIAFAQPYFDTIKPQNHSLFVLLDNSFSMQAKGKNGELLKRAVQELLEFAPTDTNLSIITATDEFWDTNIKTIQKDLQKLSYSALPFSLDNALAKIKTHNNTQGKDILIITDGIGVTTQGVTNLPANNASYFVLPKPEKIQNIGIDSVFVIQTLDNFQEIGVTISSTFTQNKAIPIAIYHEQNLIAKTIFNSNKPKQILTFTIPKTNCNGMVSIQDNSLAFDNTFYFTINQPKTLQVLSIGQTIKSNFLERIYTAPDFNYHNTDLSTLNYSEIEKQDVIVLNEIQDIPTPLYSNLKNKVTNGGTLIVIPASSSNISNLNSFVANFGKIKFIASPQIQEKKITNINFSNPLFFNVFEKKITNFQYPKVNQSFGIQGGYSKVLSFNDQTPFLTTLNKNSGTVYVFSAAINSSNSNFQQSPIIVPTFYKMAISNQKNGAKYQTIGEIDNLIIPANLDKQAVVSIKNNTQEFIPIQQIMTDKVKITCADNPKKSGNYQIMQQNKPIQNISFNYNRKESNLTQSIIDVNNVVKQVDSIEAFFETQQIHQKDTQIWKWFLIFALLFFVIELLIQKFIK